MFREDYFRSLQLPPAYAKLQKISNPLYDRLTLNGPGKFTYFKGSQGRSRLYTNFDGQSQFDNPRGYIVMGLRALVDPSVAAADLALIAQRAYFTFLIGDKPFMEMPLSLFLTKQDTIETEGRHNEATFKLDHPILIPSQQIFRPSIDIESPAALSAPTDLTLVFDGVLLRPAQ
jgi:hypothetical protein